MRILEGPINCVLCGRQIWNGRMIEAGYDGDELQHICKGCFDRFGSEDHVEVKTSKKTILKYMPQAYSHES